MSVLLELMSVIAFATTQLVVTAVAAQVAIDCRVMAPHVKVSQLYVSART